MSQITQSNADIQFFNFDFHRETAGMRYDRIAPALDHHLEFDRSIGFNKTEAGARKASQNGTIRVNCIDSLDRTGVVVTEFIRRAIADWLIDLQLWGPDSPQELPQGFEIWLRNGKYQK